MIDSAYLAQFKELMGYKESEEEKEESVSKSLFGYGFGKLERKRWFESNSSSKWMISNRWQSCVFQLID